MVRVSCLESWFGSVKQMQAGVIGLVIGRTSIWDPLT